MKTMKNTLKCLIAVFIMAMAFVVTGTTVKAVEPTYVPAVYTDMSKNPGVATKQYIVQPKGEIVIPVQIPGKGGLDVAYAATIYQQGYAYGNMYIGCYYDVACTRQVPGFYDSIATSTSGNDIAFPAAGTYYFKVKSYGDGPQILYFAAAFASGANRTIKSKQTTAIYSNNSNEWVYSKFKATKTGYIAVAAAELADYPSNIYVKLTDNKKKACSEQTALNNKYVYYGVQKGKTYYIATKSYAEFYNLYVKQTAVKEKSGSSKSKAKTIKKGKTVKGVQIANKKKSGTDWYKFYLPSRKNFKITLKGGTSSVYGRDLIVKISAANNRTIFGNTMYVENGGGTYSTKSPFSAGTYYFQVTKRDKLSSGWYSIKWK